MANVSLSAMIIFNAFKDLNSMSNLQPGGISSIGGSNNQTV